MTGALLSGLVAGYGIAVPVGAVGAYLVSLTARTTLLTGASAALGVASADLVYAAAAVLGGAALTATLAPAFDALRWGFAVVLLAVAARVLLAGVRQRKSQDARAADVPSPRRAYSSLLAITLLNPTTVVYFTALVVGGAAAALDTVP